MSRCKACDEPLVLRLEDDEDADVGESDAGPPDTVPDDLELPCGCHFHWYVFVPSLTVSTLVVPNAPIQAMPA